jgi:hypothetical protein
MKWRDKVSELGVQEKVTIKIAQELLETIFKYNKFEAEDAIDKYCEKYMWQLTHPLLVSDGPYMLAIKVHFLITKQLNLEDAHEAVIDYRTNKPYPYGINKYFLDELEKEEAE